MPLAQKVCERLQEKNLSATTVTVKVRYANFELVTRSQTVASAIRTLDQVVALLPDLLRKTEAGHRPIRLVGVALSNLGDGGVGEESACYTPIQRELEFT